MQSNLRFAGMWTGKVVLITGASDGIGASCAKLIGQRGAKLVLTAFPNENFSNEESGSRLIVTGDITSETTRIEVVKRTIDCFGRIDVLINNAGVGQYGYPTEVDTEISKRMFDVNVFSALALTQLVVTGLALRQRLLMAFVTRSIAAEKKTGSNQEIPNGFTVERQNGIPGSEKGK